jgi:hypothetical protein
MTTTAQKRPISWSVNRKALSLSAKSNIESKRNRALLAECRASRLKTRPFRHIMELEWESNIQASRTNSTSNTPAYRERQILCEMMASQAIRNRRVLATHTLSRVTWSSCDSIPKPGIRLANSTTPLIAGENLSLKSSSIRFVPPFSMTCCGKGFNGQAFHEKQLQLSTNVLSFQ